MGKINHPPARGPAFPWGEARAVRDRLVEPSQLDRGKRKRRNGAAGDPPLASSALLDFIGPAHCADELRLPPPPPPGRPGVEWAPFSDQSHLEAALERGEEGATPALRSAMEALTGPRERRERLETLLDLEREMLELLRRLHGDVKAIQRRIRDEQRGSGY